MALTQKTIRTNHPSVLDTEVNKLIKEGWEISSDVKCVIEQTNFTVTLSSNKEIWYQTVRKYLED